MCKIQRRKEANKTSLVEGLKKLMFDLSTQNTDNVEKVVGALNVKKDGSEKYL